MYQCFTHILLEVMLQLRVVLTLSSTFFVQPLFCVSQLSSFTSSFGKTLLMYKKEIAPTSNELSPFSTPFSYARFISF